MGCLNVLKIHNQRFKNLSKHFNGHLKFVLTVWAYQKQIVKTPTRCIMVKLRNIGL